MSKIIFLDIDGVLNAFNYPKELAEQNKPWRDEFGVLFAPSCVEQLKRIIDATGASIIISSSWKIPFDGDTDRDALERIREMWKKRNLPGNITDATPNLSFQEIIEMDCFSDCTRHKGYEIEQWRRYHHYHSCSYVIIDDESIGALPNHKGHFVQTTGRMGLTAKDADKVIKILNSKIL